MKNLGKYLLFLILHVEIFAGVVGYVDSKNVVLGDSVVYTLKISGDDIQRPNITELCGVDVSGVSQSSSYRDINGKISKSYRFSYQFEPQKSCVIKPIHLQIDGKDEVTKEIKISVIKTPPQTKDSKFSLQLSTYKKEVFVGEAFDVLVTFKQNLYAGALDLRYDEPKFEGFWVKGKSKPQITKQGDYSITKIVYKIAPQRVGKLDINPAKVAVATRVNGRGDYGVFVQNVKWRSYYSNTLHVDVKPLPNGVDLVGEFEIFTKYNKTDISQNEAFNVEVVVKGSGNLEDIKSFKPNIAGVNVFDEKIEVKNGIATQKLAFVSDEDFTVPPFKLTYFDTKTKKTKLIQTKEIKVHVESTPHKKMVVKQPTIQQPVTTKVIKEESFTLSIATFCIGFIFGMLFMWSKPWQIDKQNKVDIKDKKLLLIKLLPFRDDDEDVKKVVDILEKNIYENKDVKIDKKLLKEVIKRYLQ